MLGRIVGDGGRGFGVDLEEQASEINIIIIGIIVNTLLLLSLFNTLVNFKDYSDHVFHYFCYYY